MYTGRMADTEEFFRRLGRRLREIRRERGLSQESMILLGFSGKHWQQLEGGRPVTVTTLLRACEALDVNLATLLKDLDRGIYATSASLRTSALKTVLGKRRESV